MAFLDNTHIKKINEIKTIWSHLHKLERMASKENIPDIFQDNGGKVLEQVVISDMHFLPGREGNDAVDRNNVQWEFKSINISTSARGFSTDHHTNMHLLNRYNGIPWLFSIYKGVNLKQMFVLSPGELNNWVLKKKKHLQKLKVKKHQNSLNNPKIPLKYVVNKGTKIYPFPNPPIDPASLDGSNNG